MIGLSKKRRRNLGYLFWRNASTLSAPFQRCLPDSQKQSVCGSNLECAKQTSGSQSRSRMVGFSLPRGQSAISAGENGRRGRPRQRFCAANQARFLFSQYRHGHYRREKRHRHQHARRAGGELERPGLFRFSKNFKPQTPAVFINLYNNQWGTNFTEWIEGSWSSKIYLWGIDDYTNESGLITPTEETRQPLVGFYFDGKPGRLPATNKGIQLSQKGIVVTSFAPTPDNRYRLRLWEMAGNRGICEIELPPVFKSAQLCNLRDEPLPDPAFLIKDGKLKVNYKAYQPLTLMLR